MPQLSANEMRQEMGNMVVELRKKQDAVDERGVETAEETKWFDDMNKSITAIEMRIKREEDIQAREAAMAASLDEKRKTADPVKRWEDIRYPKMGALPPSREQFNRNASYFIQGWLRSSKKSHPNFKIDEDHLEAAKFFGLDLSERDIILPIGKNYRQIANEFRSVNVTTPGKGQETIPEGFVNALEMSLLTYGGMRQVAEVIRTESGNNLPWPTVNDTGNTGEIIDEEATIGNSVDPSFSQVVFKAFKYSSKKVLVSSEMLQDSAFDLGARIGEMLGIRIGRIQNAHFTTGAGTTLPKGVIVAAGVGVTATNDTDHTADEVIDLIHSVDPAYRIGASFMMHDLELARIRKLKESTTNAYIWQPGLQAGVPDRLLGYPYTINQQMSSTFTASEKVLAFGDMSKYKIRDVASIRLLRLDELHAQNDQVAFIAFLRSDGNLLDAGTDPVKTLQLAAS